MAVAVFRQPTIQGEAVAETTDGGIRLLVTWTRLPPGKHGFHIHKAGDLRGEGCKLVCDHWPLMEDLGPRRDIQEILEMWRSEDPCLGIPISWKE